MLNYDNTAFNASIGVPVSPFLLTQTAGSPTPNLLLTLQRLYGSLWFPFIALGFPFAESTASCFIRLFNSPTSPITKENLYIPHRWVVRKSAHRAKEENWNYFWKILQPQPDPDRDVPHGTITGGEMQLHCSQKQNCKSGMFEQGQMSDFTTHAAFSKKHKVQGFSNKRVLRMPWKAC